MTKYKKNTWFIVMILDKLTGIGQLNSGNGCLGSLATQDDGEADEEGGDNGEVRHIRWVLVISGNSGNSGSRCYRWGCWFASAVVWAPAAMFYTQSGCRRLSEAKAPEWGGLSAYSAANDSDLTLSNDRGELLFPIPFPGCRFSCLFGRFFIFLFLISLPCGSLST